jgi:peptide chain release factor subunit 3
LQTPVTVDMLLSDDDEVGRIVPGENVKVKVKGVEEEDVSPGFVLCDAVNPIHTGRVFDAQLVILEHKSIICAGYSAVMHIHCAAEEVTVKVSGRGDRGGV